MTGVITNCKIACINGPLGKFLNFTEIFYQSGKVTETILQLKKP